MPASLPAQETRAPAPAPAAAGSPPLARFFAKDGLVFYLEFAGVDAHAEAWNKTAAYKMLTETPLGEMLEEVGAQLLDKVLSYSPGHKLGGRDIITLIEHASHRGVAIGVHMKPFVKEKAAESFQLTMVFRDGAAKEHRVLWSRVMAAYGAGGTAGLERRNGRTLVVIPPPGAQPGKKQGGRAWWAERDDLVASFAFPWGPDAVMAAIDGKVPTAVDHPVVQELTRKDGTFEPACIAFLDAENAPHSEVEPGFGTFLHGMNDTYGIRRLAYRFGFDDDAVMQEFRIVAPKPRKPLLTLFEQPTFDGRAMLPLPQGVESFLQVSVDLNNLIDAVGKFGPGAPIKAKVDELAEAFQSRGKADFHKDFLGRIGPRIALFLAPEKSAAVGSFETNWLQGLSPQAGVPTAMLAQWKPTLLTEVSDPKIFSRHLEGAVNALNHQFELKTAELMQDEEKPENGEPGGPGGPGGRRGGGMRAGRGGARGTPKRSPSSLAPHFVPMVTTTGAVAVGSDTGPQKVAYQLKTHSDSPLKIGPPNFHPVIKLEDKYLVFSISADAADAALKAARQKDWQPSPDLRKAGEHLPAKMVILGVVDPRELMPTVLASLPGTLQTIINSGIAMARAAAANPQGMPGGPGGDRGPGNRGPGGPGGAMRPRGMGVGGSGAGRDSAASMPGGSAPGGSGGPGGSAPGGSGGPGGAAPVEIPADAMVELKVEPDKLPKADDLKSRYFLSTVAVTVTDDDIRLISREAFVSQLDLASMAGSVALILPAVQAAREAARRAEAVQAAKEKSAGEQAPAGPGANRPGAPGGGPGMPGRRGRGRGPGG